MATEHSDMAADTAVYESRPTPDLEMAYEASEVISHMLGDGRSMIAPETTIWTAESAEDLQARIGDNQIIGTGQGQWEKLDEQLKGAYREVTLLAADLVFLREHPLRSSLPETSTEHVERVLKHLSTPLTIPEPMSTWLSRPSGTAGFESGSWYNPSAGRRYILRPRHCGRSTGRWGELWVNLRWER